MVEILTKHLAELRLAVIHVHDLVALRQHHVAPSPFDSATLDRLAQSRERGKRYVLQRAVRHEQGWTQLLNLLNGYSQEKRT